MTFDQVIPYVLGLFGFGTVSLIFYAGWHARGLCDRNSQLTDNAAARADSDGNFSEIQNLSDAAFFTRALDRLRKPE